MRTKILKNNPRSAMFIRNLGGEKISEDGDFAIYEQTLQNRRKALRNIAKKMNLLDEFNALHLDI